MAEDPNSDRTTTTVTITVLDLNDERPSFSTNQTRASVNEELPIGSHVQMEVPLSVTDSDQV